MTCVAAVEKNRELSKEWQVFSDHAAIAETARETIDLATLLRALRREIIPPLHSCVRWQTRCGGVIMRVIGLDDLMGHPGYE